MPVRQKTFRIEQMTRGDAPASAAPIAPPDTFSHAHPTDATGADPSADERRT